MGQDKLEPDEESSEPQTRGGTAPAEAKPEAPIGADAAAPTKAKEKGDEKGKEGTATAPTTSNQQVEAKAEPPAKKQAPPSKPAPPPPPPKSKPEKPAVEKSEKKGKKGKEEKPPKEKKEKPQKEEKRKSDEGALGEPKEKKGKRKSTENFQQGSRLFSLIQLKANASSSKELSSTELQEKSSSKTSRSQLRGKSASKHLSVAQLRGKRSSIRFDSLVRKSSEFIDEYSTSSEEEEEELRESKSILKAGKLKSKTSGLEMGKALKGKVSIQEVGKAIKGKVSAQEDGKEIKGKEGKKGGKGKGKGKKEAIVEEEEPIIEPEPDDEFLANVLRMRAAVAAASRSAIQLVTDEDKKKKKQEKGPKKELSKVEKQKMAIMMEQMKKEAELEAARQAESERSRQVQETKAAIEKERRQIHEQVHRLDQLEKSFMQIEEARNCYKKLAKDEREISEWNLYIACGELPNPSIINKMSTYLHLWEQASKRVTIDEASKRTADVLQLLADVEDLLDSSPEEDVDATKIENWKWLRQLFRDLQRHTLDVVTYRLLRCVESNLHRIDIPTADFNFEDSNFKFSLWCRVQLPIPLPNPRRPPKSRLDINFPNVKMQVLFPVTIDCEYMAIRIMYLKYDHLSDLSSTYHMPHIPHQILEGTHNGLLLIPRAIVDRFCFLPLLIDIADASKREWRVKLQYKYDHRDIVEDDETPAKNVEQKEDEKNEETAEDEIPIVPYKKLTPTASEVAIAYEDILYNGARQRIELQLPDYVLNLRKYIILGGVYYLNLVEQPPQPQDFVTMDLNITRLYLPKRLEYVPFYVRYVPPAPPGIGMVRTPEEIEEELKIHEAEMDKLMLVTMTWPTHVIFIELPLVYHWEEEEKVWSKRDVFDLKHNEEKGTLSFRTGAFGIFGLATLRFTNMPFQAWELKPEIDGSVTFQITAAIVLIEFNVKGGLVCISLLKNSPNPALKRIVGVYLKLYKLKRILKETGIDIFPENDSFCYIEGNCEKHWPMERHLYCNMAAISNCFNFMWSRWNLTAGRRQIIMQMRESLPDKIKQKPYSMLLVTPFKASFVECTEVSQVFCDDDIEGLKFSADLWNLLKVTTSITIRKKIQSASQEEVYVLSQLLLATRVMSFS